MGRNIGGVCNTANVLECSTNARQGQCTRFPFVAAATFPVLFHRTGIRGIHRDVHRFRPPPGRTDGVRNVDRRRPGRGVAPFPRPPILRGHPLGRPAGRADPGPPGRGPAAPARRGDPARHRRNPDPTAWTEGLRRVLVARRLRRRHHEDRLRQQLGGAGDRGHPAVLPTPDRAAHPVHPVRQRWPQQTRPRPRPPRPGRRSPSPPEQFTSSATPPTAPATSPASAATSPSPPEPAATPCSTTPHRRPAGNAADQDSAANASAPPPTSPPRPTRTTPGPTP